MIRVIDEEDVNRVLARQDSSSVVAPSWIQMHFESALNGISLQSIIQKFTQVSSQDSPVYVIELDDLPNNRKFSVAGEFLHSLKYSAGEIAICLDLISPKFDIVPMGKVDWVGFSMHELDINEDDALNAIAEFAAGCEKLGVRPYAKDLPSKNIVMTAIALGIR